MGRWIYPRTDFAAWKTLFTGFRSSAFRLEGQQAYCSEYEDGKLADFLSGRPVNMDWTFVRETSGVQAAAGRPTTKVRVVVEPWTPYTRLELSQYPAMAEIGEDIRILAVPEGEWPADVPHHDYWLFDDRDLWRMHYYENFHFKGAELIEDEAVVDEHRVARDAAIARSMPLEEYLVRHPDITERTPA